MLNAQFQQAAMSRADIPEDERRDFDLVVDEFHNFTSDSLATTLDEARNWPSSFGSRQPPVESYNLGHAAPP